MAAPRFTLLLLRTSRTALSSSTQRLSHLPATSRQLARPLSVTPRRLFESNSKSNSALVEEKDDPIYYDFKSMELFSKNPSKDRVLIDTREPEELKNTGTIPGSINIPVTSQPEAFFIPKEEFENRFGFARPSQDMELVFYCRSGVRSATAAQFARNAGWERVKEYPGSWLDWERNKKLNK